MSVHLTWAAVLLAVGVAAFLLAPRVLGHGRWRLRQPQLCLTLWYVVFLGGVTSVLTAAVLSVVAGVRAYRTTSRGPELGPTADVIAAWLALGVSGPVLSVVLTQVGAMVVTERQARSRFALLTHCEGCRPHVVSGIEAWVVPGPDITAVSLRRSGPQIVVTSTVVELLSPAQLLALLEHERAHLRRLHDVAARLAALNAACLPPMLTPRSLSRSTALLVELAADRAAARRTSTPTTISTLRTLSAACTSTAEATTLELRAALLAS